MESWFPSLENEEALLQLKENQVEVERMFYAGPDPTALPTNAPLLAIARHFVARGNKTKFEEVFNDVKPDVALCTGRQDLVKGGWKTDKDGQWAREEE